MTVTGVGRQGLRAPCCPLDLGNSGTGMRLLLGVIAGSPFYIDHRQFEAWKHTQLILDVGAGEPEGFSLAAGEDRHFITRSRVFSDEELVALEAAEPA